MQLIFESELVQRVKNLTAQTFSTGNAFSRPADKISGFAMMFARVWGCFPTPRGSGLPCGRQVRGAAREEFLVICGIKTTGAIFCRKCLENIAWYLKDLMLGRDPTELAIFIRNVSVYWIGFEMLFMYMEIVIQRFVKAG